METVQFLDIQQLRPDPVPDLNSPLNDLEVWSDDDTVHWTKGNASATLPIAYVSDDTLKVKVRFSGNIDPSIDNIIVRYHVAGISEGAWSDWKDVSEDANGLYVDDFDWVSNFANFVYESSIALSVPSLTLSWQMAVATAATAVNSGLEEITNESQRNVLGESHNPLYVLYDDPIQASPLYLTLVHTACTAANGQYTESYVFDAIWEKLESKSIKKAELQNGVVVETDLLTYYGKEAESTSIYTKEQIEGMIIDTLCISNDYSQEDSPSLARQYANTILYIQSGICFTTSGLLQKTDGTCGAWKNFMIDVLKTQGITTIARSITINQGGSVTDFKIVPNALGQGTITIDGENTKPKESIWSNHGLVEYNGIIYDPSYGKCYGPKDGDVNVNDALTEFVLQSVESIGTTRRKNINEPTDGRGWVYTASIGSIALSQVVNDYLTLS
ncbi:MAG: hypothetical protein J6X44_09525 [Thermoguttaceae bacterium]|nr:hypothetical protein [Thermoguttaceae bacterium]